MYVEACFGCLNLNRILNLKGLLCLMFYVCADSAVQY